MGQEFDAFRKHLEAAEREKQAKLKGFHEEFCKELQSLRDARAKLDAERERVGARIEEVKQRIAEVEHYMASGDEVQIRDVVIGIIPKLKRKKDGREWWSINDMMALVWREKPSVSSGSVRSALSRLYAEKKHHLCRLKMAPASGGRKEFHYMLDSEVTGAEWKAIEEYEESHRKPDGSPEDDDGNGEPEATPEARGESSEPEKRTGEQQELLDAEVDLETAIQEGKEFVEREDKRLAAEGASEPWADDKIRGWFDDQLKKHPGGIDNKLVAWLIAEQKATPETIERVLKAMEAEGLIETANDGGAEIIRTPAKNGSKEELKRLKVQDKPLFPGVQRPDHA